MGKTNRAKPDKKVEKYQESRGYKTIYKGKKIKSDKPKGSDK